MRILLGHLAAVAMVFLLVGCAQEPPPPSPPPPRGELVTNLDMIGKDGRYYGRVELGPVGRGRVFDADGRAIGDIVPPGSMPPPPPPPY